MNYHKLIKCEHCPKKMRKYDLKNHVLKKHTINTKPESKHNKKNFYQCIECNIILRYSTIFRNLTKLYFLLEV